MKEPRASDRTTASEHRLLELLADRAIFGLDREEEVELAALLAAHPDADHESLDRIAAALAVGQLTGPPAAAPARPAAAAGRGRKVLLIAAATAALFALVALPVASRRPGVVQPATAPRVGPESAADADLPAPDGYARAREELLAKAEDAVRLDCRAMAPAAASDDASGAAAGDIVWSPSRQRGFLRISGLPPNDPRESQYQIWIVVGRRTVPVSGGVFDVAAAGGRLEVVVPILPRDFVQGPAIFAVTTERPGGADEYSAERAQAVARAE